MALNIQNGSTISSVIETTIGEASDHAYGFVSFWYRVNRYDVSTFNNILNTGRTGGKANNFLYLRWNGEDNSQPGLFARLNYFNDNTLQGLVNISYFPVADGSTSSGFHNICI